MASSSEPSTIPPEFDLPAPPAAARFGLLGASVLVGLSSLPWIAFSFGRFGGFDWSFFGFEALTLLGAVYGVLLGLGWYRSGWAIGIASIAGSWLVCLVFGLYVGFYRAKLQDNPDLETLAKGTLVLRAAIIVLSGLLASVAVFARHPGSWRSAIAGVLWALPVAILGTLVTLDLGPGAWLRSLYEGSGDGGSGGVRAVAVIASGLVTITLVSISGHLIIRAYELGRPEPTDPGN